MTEMSYTNIFLCTNSCSYVRKHHSDLCYCIADVFAKLELCLKMHILSMQTLTSMAQKVHWNTWAVYSQCSKSWQWHTYIVYPSWGYMINGKSTEKDSAMCH